MFDTLSERLRGVFDTLRGQTRITEEVLEKTLREIRMALLEADVNVRFEQRQPDLAEGLVEDLLGDPRLAAQGFEDASKAF